MSSKCQDAIILTTTIVGSFYMFNHCNNYFTKEMYLEKISHLTYPNLLFTFIPLFSNSFFLGASTVILFTTFTKSSNLLNKI